MAIRTINSPGIEITERDISQYTTGPVGTAVLVTGFAAKGRDYEPILITSRSAWLQQFGEPSNEAEKYFFNAGMEVINQGGKLYACKLPYKNKSLNKFTAKTYTVNVADLHMLSTVAEYANEYELDKILAGDFTAFGYTNPEKYKKDIDILFQTKDLQKQFLKFSHIVDNYTIAIPYAYAEDEWMNQINIPGTEEDNWMYTPVKFIIDKLGALLNQASDFYMGGVGPDGNAFIGFNEWINNISAYVPSGTPIPSRKTIELSALGFNDDQGQAERVELFAGYVLQALGGNPNSQAFRTACDPSSGVTLESVVNTYGTTFTESRIYQFFKDNEEIFNLLNTIDFETDNTLFGGLKTYNYCDATKFNLGSYYKAFKDYEKSKDYAKEFAETPIVEMWNKVSRLDDFFDAEQPSLSTIFDKPVSMLVPLTAYVDHDYPTSADPAFEQPWANELWANTDESNDALKCKMITRLSNEILTPLDTILECFDNMFADPNFEKLVESAKKGLYHDTPFAKLAIRYYIDNTIISNPDTKTALRNAKDLNIFFEKFDDDGLSSTERKTVFESYNGPDSATPELSSVEAVIDATIDNLKYDEFLKFSMDFTQTSAFETLTAYAYGPETSSEWMQTQMSALLSDSIVSSLAYSEIKKADPTIKSYLTINSESDVELKDLEEIDGYATGETPVRTNRIVIVDKTRGTLGTAYAKAPDGTQKELVGIIPVITTAANALYVQALLDTGDSGISKYNAVKIATTLNDSFIVDDDEKPVGPLSIDNADAAIPFMSDNAGDYTVSQMAAASFPSIHFTSEGTMDRQNMKKIGVVVLRAFLDPGEGNKVNYDIVEAYAGELDKEATDPNTGASTFIDDIVNNQSEYIELYSNCFNQTATRELYSKMDLLVVNPQQAGDLGFYQYMVKKNISLTDSIMKALPLVWEKNEDINEKQIDIVCDAGVSNIAQFIKSVFAGKAGEYDPASEYATLFKLRNKEDTKTYRAILAMYDNFCKNIRKDCMFVADGPRPFCLQGNKKIVRPSKPSNTIDATILPMLKYITGINTNYGAGYCDWFQKADEFSGDYFWCPPSIQATGVYLNTDINFDFWEAPAGLNRGIVPALDIAFSPTQRQADEIYPKCWNYARNYPNDGIVLEGQRTFQTKSSSLDRVAARRALLRFERIVYEIARWYVYETNNAYNRQRFYDDVDGVFKEIKAQGGMFDYRIICDETINTEEVLERNEFRAKIGVKLNKFMEFIIIEFNVLRRGGSWSEML